MAKKQQNASVEFSVEALNIFADMYIAITIFSCSSTETTDEEHQINLNSELPNTQATTSYLTTTTELSNLATTSYLIMRV